MEHRGSSLLKMLHADRFPYLHSIACGVKSREVSNVHVKFKCVEMHCVLILKMYMNLPIILNIPDIVSHTI